MNFDQKTGHSFFPTKDKEAFQRFVAIGGSAGGAKPKAVICRKGDSILSGLLKVPPPGYQYELIKIQPTKKLTLFDDVRDYAKVEYVYHLLAVKAGIPMERCELIECEGSFHFTTRRFDRREDGSKLHLQTLAAIQNWDYRTHSPHVEDIFQTINRLTSSDRRQREDMWRRKIFNIISCNTDDHAKNTSFLMNEKGEWSLAPAYDISFEPIPAGFRRKFSTYLNGKNSDFKKSDIIACGLANDIRPHLLLEEVGEAFSSFAQLAKENGISAQATSTIIKDTTAAMTELGVMKSLHQIPAGDLSPSMPGKKKKKKKKKLSPKPKRPRK